MLILLSKMVEALRGWPPIRRHLRIGRTALHALVLRVYFGLPPLLLMLLLANHKVIQLLLCVWGVSIEALVRYTVRYRNCCHWWTSLIHARCCVSYYGCSMRHGWCTIHEWRSCATGRLTASLVPHSHTPRTRLPMLHSGRRPCWTTGIPLTGGVDIYRHVTGQR